MIKRDYHGWLRHEARLDVESIIGQIRIMTKGEQAEFITGFGSIREELLEVLKSHDLEPTLKLGNEGVIVVTIE